MKSKKNINYTETTSVNIDVENSVPIWHKVSLTLDEAVAYSGIGKNTLRKLSDERGQSFTFFVGEGRGKRMIKRKEFDEFISKVNII